MSAPNHPRGQTGTDHEGAKTRPGWLTLAPWLFVALWSCGYAPVRIGLDYIEPVFFMAVRYAIVLALLLPAYLWVRPPLPQSGRAWLHLAIVGTLIQGVYFTLTNVAIKLGASAAGLGIVLALQPILVALIVPRIVHERVTGTAWLGLVLGLAGVVIVILAKSGGGVGDATVAGIATACAALVFITAGTVWEKRFGTTQHPIVANIVQCAMGLLVALAVALPTETLAVRWEWPLILSMAYLVIGNSLVAMTLLLAMVRHGQATRASALLFLVPPGSAAIAWALVGEPFPPLAFAGMMIAGLGVWLVRAR